MSGTQKLQVHRRICVEVMTRMDRTIIGLTCDDHGEMTTM